MSHRLRIGVSMREVRAADSGELRDALAASWGDFLAWSVPEAAWIPLPNLGPAAAGYLDNFELDGLILTGGDDIGSSPRRDATERALLAACRNRGLPVLGICRGAQLMWDAQGGSLIAVAGHVAARHTLSWTDDAPEHERGTHAPNVNSFHRWGLSSRELPAGIVVLALAPDASVEMFRHPGRKWFAVMWHPERETPFRDGDRLLLRQALGLDTARETA